MGSEVGGMVLNRANTGEQMTAPPYLGNISDDDEYTGLLSQGGEGTAREAKVHGKKISSWKGTSVIMCANLMGAGVLALPEVMKYVGWLPGIALICALALGAIYSGLLITRIWTLADHADKYGDLGKFAYGNKGQTIVNSVTYFYITVVTVVFHLTSAESLQTVFYDIGGHYCLWQYSLVIIFMILPLAQIKSLQNVSYLAIIGAGTIIATVFIAVVRLLLNGPLPDTETVLINTSSKDIRQKINTLVMIVFSYCGQAIFTELISSMQTPKDFPKAVLSSTLTMMFSYILIAGVGYAILGQLAIAPVTSALPEDFWAQIANVFLFAHVLIAYLIEINILTKGMVLLFPPANANMKPSKGRNRLVWFLSSTFLVLMAFLLSNLCSFFAELLSFAGATGGIATTYIFPCLFILKVDPNIGKGESIVCKVIVVLSCIFSVVCLYNTVLDIAQKWHDVGPPFMCMSCVYKKEHKLTPGVC